MSLIIHLETATSICSVALAENGKLIADRKSGGKDHARLLTVLIDELINECGYTYASLDAVAVSKGPGSYTGLRIGVATAKGLCYALDRPLIAVNTLYSLAVCMKHSLNGNEDKMTVFCPMIDARRMEVYTAAYNYLLEEIIPVQAMILSPESLPELKEYKVILAGDGAEKFLPVSSMQITLLDVFPDARGLIMEALRKYHIKDFESTAYFEPFYLKDFAGVKP
jgi:tRNA threonylcarbamoyladenosine biosynthesis protein TsaB